MNMYHQHDLPMFLIQLPPPILPTAVLARPTDPLPIVVLEKQMGKRFKLDALEVPKLCSRIIHY